VVEMRVRAIKITNSLSDDVRITAKAVITVINEKVGYISKKEFGDDYWKENAEAELIIDIEKVEEGEQ